MKEHIKAVCEKHGKTTFIWNGGRSGKGAYVCRLCRNAVSTERRRKAKLRAIEYCGGKCERCGGVYAGRPEVFDFHHKDPAEKDTSIALLMRAKFEKVMRELDKCILLCANCHRTLHSEEE